MMNMLEWVSVKSWQRCAYYQNWHRDSYALTPQSGPEKDTEGETKNTTSSQIDMDIHFLC